MRIKTRVKIGATLTICVLLSYGVLVLYLDGTMANLSREVGQVSDIVNKTGLLRNLTQDYLLYRTERAQRQWSGIYAEVLQLLDHPEYRDLQSKYGIGDAPARLKIVGDTFGQAIALQADPAPGDPTGELQNRLSTQLLLASHSLQARFSILNQEINKKLFATQRLTSVLDILALLVLGGVLISTMVFLQRSVVKPVLKLQAGAAIIGAGNLEHRVDTGAQDEVGQLSRAFDEMTGNLRQTVRRLEEELAERQRAEGVIKTSHHFLQMMNRLIRMPSLLHDFVAEVKSLTQCEAVGIRILDEAGNIPYKSYEGFSKDFYEMESPLVIHSDKCMCINVINGATDPNLPFYTPGGSFYMNATTRFLATVSEEDKGQTRNVCNATGYESVALVPIRLGERILGLIHLADKREDMVPLQTVELLEFVALQLGPALQRINSQEKIAELNEKLEQRVKERTAELERSRDELVQEIEVRRLAEEALRQSTAKLQTIFDNLNEGVVVSSMDGQLTDWNRAALKMHGYPSLEGSHHRFAEVPDTCEVATLEGDVLPKEQWPLPRILRGEQFRDLDLHVRRKDVKLERIVSYSGALVYEQEGVPLMAIVMMNDVTERRRAEEALRQARDELEQRVIERTRELHQTVAQLQEEVTERQQAEQALQKSEQSLRDLASQILTAQEQERKRIAMELHEGLAQSMTSLKLFLRAIEQHLPAKEKRIKEDFDAAHKMIITMIDDVRRISMGLTPSLLETLGLTAALKHLLQAVSKSQKIKVNVVTDKIENLFSPQTEINLFRIFQESLNNIAKHARATQVFVSIKRQNGRVDFLIKDDGDGFDLQQTLQRKSADKGMGIAAMDERLRMIGTQFNIMSQPGMGTEISFSIPVDVK